MLSRVAENIYWMSRYIERAENTARLVSVAVNLVLDLPRGMQPGWAPLIAISGSDAIYRHHHQDFGERAVLRFLIGAKHNPDSILESLARARENCRTIRDIVPREIWEQINALHIYACENMQVGLTKRGRHPFLRGIVLRCQTIAGKVSGTMNRDQAYQFLRLGQSLERADMTTRIIDVSSAHLLHEDGPDFDPFANTRWMAVLRSPVLMAMLRADADSEAATIGTARVSICVWVYPVMTLSSWCVGLSRRDCSGGRSASDMNWFTLPLFLNPRRSRGTPELPGVGLGCRAMVCM